MNPKERTSFIGFSLITVGILIILVSLGSWQIQRMHWKNNLLSFMEYQKSSDSDPIDEFILNFHKLPQAEFTKIKMTGRFMHDHEIRLYPRTYKGKVGAFLLTPFQLPRGPIIFVDRGWIPDGPLDRIAIRRPEGQTTLSGYAYLPPQKNMLTPPNLPEGDVWLTVNLEEKFDQLEKRIDHPIRAISEFYVVAEEASTLDAYPWGRGLPIDIPNNHLGYVVTWFGLALALMIVYLMYVKGHYAKRPSSPKGMETRIDPTLSEE